MKRYWIFISTFLLIAVGIILFFTLQQQHSTSSLVKSTIISSSPTAVDETAVTSPATITPVLTSTSAPTATTTPASVTASPEPLLPPGVVAGLVLTDEGPVEGAVVRVRATEKKTFSGADGSFRLTALAMSDPISVTVWSDGYYGGGVTAIPGTAPITITLQPYHTTDNNRGYKFASAEACSECHANYVEWQADAHAQAAVNPRYLSVYNGTDVHGNRAELERDVSGLPLRPEPGEPYYGPGFRSDFPNRTGNCAACHTPMASSLETDNTCGWSGCHTEFTTAMADEVPYGVSSSHLVGVAAEGINCDFCHKIGQVILNPAQNRPWEARPGISSMRLYRPPEGADLFFGPLDDVPSPDSYLPLQEESAFCAPCHYGQFGGVAGSHEVTGGVEIYNSYGEWLESPYSDPKTGQTCQDCHMPPVDYEYFVFPEAGGFRRDPNQIHNHLMPGAADETFLKNAMTMTVAATVDENQLVVKIDITNDNTGHHLPTGVPLRQMFLVIEAREANGDLLALGEGQLLPDWAGNYAGQPGRYFAKILEDKWTGEVPTAAFWRDIRLVEDTRLPALATDTSQYVFDHTASGPVTVTVQLIFRRAFQDLIMQKDWDAPDIVMAVEAVVVEAP